MKRILVAVAALLVPLTLSAPSPARAATTARNYDCSKPGNANKAVCKNTAVAAKPATAPASKARNYDCSKPGNATKAVCKSAVAPAPTLPRTAAPAKTVRNYDCSKAGNANKAVCKASTTATAATPSTQVSTPTTPASRAPSLGQNTNAAGPNGATAKCRDGSFSKSAHRAGTCSRHGGVAQWY